MCVFDIALCFGSAMIPEFSYILSQSFVDNGYRVNNDHLQKLIAKRAKTPF
jgi:hypothetical protein